MKKIALAVSFLTLACAAASIPAFAGPVYSSGTPNFDIAAWLITATSGDSVTDSFSLSQSAIVNGATFAFWATPGDSLSSVKWSIGTTPYGTDVDSGTATPVASDTQSIDSGYFTGGVETFSFSNKALAANTTYYFTLTDAVTVESDYFSWDVNDGSSVGYSSALGPDNGAIAPADCYYYDDCGTDNILPSGGETFSLTDSQTPVPEPSSFLLLGTGLAGIAGLVRRKLKA